jgi:putative alpha-1,2-mannosidase
LTNAATAGDIITTISFYVSSVLNAIPNSPASVQDSNIVSVAGSKLTGTQTIPKATLPTGCVLQVAQTVKTDTFTSSSASWVDVTGFSVVITPSSASNKILVNFSGYVTQSGGSGTYAIMLRLVRNSTNISIGNARSIEQQASAQIGSNSNNYAQCLTGSYLDSPATTSAITYKLQMYVESGGTGLIGGSYVTSNAYNASTPSQILVMEISA